MDPEGDLDLEQASRLLGDAGLVPLVAQAFAASAPPLLLQLRQAIAANEEMEVRRHLHRLTPTLALLSRQGLQDDCEQVSAMWRVAGTAERQAHSLALVDRIDALVNEASRQGSVEP